jgi:Flp pilus assembly protein TadD
MAGINEDRARQVVPLWRDASVTAIRGELASAGLVDSTRFNDEMVATLRKEWEESQILHIACDLVSVAMTLGRFDVARKAAEEILANPAAKSSARDVAELYLRKGLPRPRKDKDSTEGDQPVSDNASLREQIYLGIGAARRRLIAYPRNPVVWSNLALLYTSLGLHVKAERAIISALTLAPENRFVLRSASRFYLHTNRKDMAHRLLSSAGTVRFDPWVLSAEIATAAAVGRTSRNIKVARKMLEAKHFSPFHLSELASALGTLESHHGNLKTAKPLVVFSLKEPAENSIAQAAWLHRTYQVIGSETPLTSSSEANAWYSWQATNWKPALSYAKQWLLEQPFSSRPAMLGAHVASVLMQDNAEGAAIASQGLLSNPDDFSLQNLLAFSFARQGDVTEAAKVFRRVDESHLTLQQRVVWMATWGLIAFRDNNPNVGRRLYMEAINLGKRLQDVREPLARVYYAFEEIRIGAQNAEAIRNEALEGASVFTEPSLRFVVERLKTAKPAQHTPTGQQILLSYSSPYPKLT